MLVSILLLLVIVVGGLAVTYLIADDEPLMWRICAANVIGSAIFGTLAFVVSSAAGFTSPVLMMCLAASLVPLLVFRNPAKLKLLKQDWARANGKLRGANAIKAARFVYYAFFAVLLIAFFRRAMIETQLGIFTGGSQNLGDLPFHLGVIFGFTDGGNFPPQNPSFAGARFSYPFIADFLTASFVRLGAGVADAIFVQNVSWAFALLVLLERFVFKLTGDRLSGKMAPAILFFSGGLGFVAFFTDFWSQGKAFTDFIWQIPLDYTIRERFRWGNSLVVMFLTQRSILLGMPLTILVLGVLWRVVVTDPDENRLESEPKFSILNSRYSIFLVGLLAGLLPLIHVHSLAVLFVVGVFLFILQPQKWKIWITFAAGVGVIAIPQLFWSLSGSASETGKFIGWHFGWDKGTQNFFWFWFTNTGIFIPAAAAGLYLVWKSARAREVREPHVSAKARKGVKVSASDTRAKHASDSSRIPHPASLLFFFLPFAFLFVVSNVAKLAPWEWDNIKVLAYWFLGSIPFAAYAISWLWHQNIELKVLAVVCFTLLTFAGALDVWRTVSGQINYKVFDVEAVLLAERVKKTTEPNALFLNAPTYNTAVVLTGRRSLMRYPGHLSSHGIDYAMRENDLKRIYQGGPDAAALMEKYQIEYVLISPEERNSMSVNDGYFAKFPTVAVAGQYRVHKIR